MVGAPEERTALLGRVAFEELRNTKAWRMAMAATSEAAIRTRQSPSWAAPEGGWVETGRPRTATETTRRARRAERGVHARGRTRGRRKLGILFLFPGKRQKEPEEQSFLVLFLFPCTHQVELLGVLIAFFPDWFTYRTR